METVEQNDRENEGASLAVLVLMTESLDLPALDLSSMSSPALTTDGGDMDTGLYDATSEGLSMATEDKEELRRWNEQGDDKDDGISGGGDWREEADLEDEAKSRQDDAPHRDSEAEQAEEDKHSHDDINGERDEGGDQAETKMKSRCEKRMEGSGRSSPSEVKPSSSASSRRGSTSDDDITTECASPRDPVALDDVSERDQHVIIPAKQHLAMLKEARGAESCPAVVHPLPLPAAECFDPGVKSSYSVKSIFPVVYDAPIATSKASTQVQPLELTEALTTIDYQPPPVPTKLLKDKTNGIARAEPLKTRAHIQSRDVAEKMRSLRQEVEVLKDHLQTANKGLNLQLQVAQTELNQLAQRNTRLKAQLVTLATELTRSKAEAAKLKMENELYAAKLPKLQAELCEETSQADEKHALTIQSQVEISQLRAKVQVLQTRSMNLDGQVEKLQQDLRLAKKELRRRTIVQQQNEEKLKKLENELQESKTNYSQEILHARNKLTITIQRMDLERIKNEKEATKKLKQRLEEAKDVAAKAVRRRKELEQLKNTVEQQFAVLKKRFEDQDEETNDHIRQCRELEAAMVRTERIESTLRDQNCALKAQLQSAEMENKKLLRSSRQSAPATSRLRSPRRVCEPSSSPDRRVRLSVRREEAFDQPQQPYSTLCSCCRAILSSEDRVDNVDLIDDTRHPAMAEDTRPTFACARCPALEQQIDKAHEELLQVRLLHASELKIQANAFERAISMARGSVH